VFARIELAKTSNLQRSEPVLIGKNFDEKRDFMRMQINSTITLNHAGVEYQGVCKDLSSTGMLVETNHQFDIGEELKVAIAPSNDNTAPFNAVVEVLRSDKNEEEAAVGSHILGFTIKKIF